MKSISRLALSVCLISIIGFACSPDNVKPNADQPEAGANYMMTDGHGFPPAQVCQPIMTLPMVSESYGANVILGNVKIAQSPDVIMFLETASSGLALTACYLNGGLGSEPIRQTADGKIDVTSFRWGGALPEPVNTWLMTIPIEKTAESNEWVIYSKVNAFDANGNSLFSDGIWALGKGAELGYTIGMTNQLCEGQSSGNWGGGCAVPSGIGPGDDISEYATKGGKKYAICHLPPGNPANIQNIEIGRTALDAHIIDFKPLDNPCMGHHSGCHLGTCDPCGDGSTLEHASSIEDNCPGN